MVQAYKDDPTIVSWNLINEPRCDNGGACGSDMQAWIAKMALYLRSVDPNHLITVGVSRPHVPDIAF